MRAAFERAADRAGLDRVTSDAACIAAIVSTILLHHIAIVAPATASIVAMVMSSSADRICRDMMRRALAAAIGMRREGGAGRLVPWINAASLRARKSPIAIGTATPCRTGLVVVAPFATLPQ
ncbi:MAG: hypothetical protein JO052_30040 [Bradyrhizobium sp.]|nr:hypothetical protein [Bradyrhizobium sp.]